MTNELKYLLFIFILCTPVHKVYSQDKTNVTTPCYWLHGGIGFGLPGDFLHGGLGVSTEFGNFMISARAAQASSFDGPTNINDIGVLFGISKKSTYMRVSFSGGLGYVHGSEFTDGTTGSTIGIPLEIQAFTTAAHFVGVGVCGEANINLKSSFFSILMYAQIGKLR